MSRVRTHLLAPLSSCSQIVVLVYIIVFVIIIKKGYQKTDLLTGTSTNKVC